MKKIFFTAVAVLAFVSTALLQAKEFNSNNNNIPKVADFSFSQDIDYTKPFDSFLDEKTRLKVYVLSMKNSKDKLVAYLNKNEVLIPVAFFDSTSNLVSYKDVNNLKVVTELLLTDGKITSVKYNERNDSKTGYALSFGCMGGSTLGCVRIAEGACSKDAECNILCTASGWRCHAAIVIACVANCGIQ